MKKGRFIHVFILMFIVILFLPTRVFADEICDAYKSAHNNGVINMQAVSPLALNEEVKYDYYTLLGNYIREYDENLLNLFIEDYYVQTRSSGEPYRFNSDFTQYTVYLAGTASEHRLVRYDSSDEKVACALTVNWATFNEDKANEVADVYVAIKDIEPPVFYDLSTIDGSDTTAYLDLIKKHATEHITFEDFISVDQYSCDDVVSAYNMKDPCSNVIHSIAIKYDDEVYGYHLTPTGYYYPVFYIPDFTAENSQAYLDALRKRLDMTFNNIESLELSDNDNSEVSNNSNTYNCMVANDDSDGGDDSTNCAAPVNPRTIDIIEYGLNEGYISSSLNADFPPVFAYLKVKGDDTRVKILIAKADEDDVLKGTSQAYKEYYKSFSEEEKEEYVPIPSTGSFKSNMILVVGLISILIGSSVVYTVIKKKN